MFMFPPGSSAGAGSGEFHVYRHLRRKEYARQRFIEEQAKKEEMDRKFKEMVEANKRKAEERTAKKRAKRLKKKERMKRAKLMKKNNPKKKTDKTDSEEDESDSNDDSEGSESDAKSASNCALVSGDEVKQQTSQTTEKTELESQNNEEVTGSKLTSINQTRPTEGENDSTDEEIIGPMPPTESNLTSTKEVDSETKSDTHNNSNKKVESQKVEDQMNVISPMPDKTETNPKLDNDDESESDDEIIGPMPN